MAAKTLPLEVDLTIWAGTTFRREFRWLPGGINATPMDFTGWAATMLIGPSRGTALVALSTDNLGITLTATGQIIATIDASTTGALPNGNVIYTLDLTDPSGYVQRFLRGRMSIVREVDPA